MNVFVSGQLNEKRKIRKIFKALLRQGHHITHDWTRTDNLGPDYRSQADEAGRRAQLDINGVAAADLYILITDNLAQGKGMYVELGAALALAVQRGAPEIIVVGPRNHESIFYYHPVARHFETIEDCLAYTKTLGADAEAVAVSA